MSPMYATIRIVIAVVSTLIFFAGVALIVAGGPSILGGVQALIIGAIGILAVTLERGRYRSEHAERVSAPAGPGGGENNPLEARFQRTEEAFIDPTSGRHMRVFLDPQTGERRYQAEG